MRSLDDAIRSGPIADELLLGLKADFDSRRIAQGMRRLASCDDMLQSFSPTGENATRFLVMVAQWCDTGFGDINLNLVKGLVETFTEPLRSGLTVSDYIRLRAVEGMIAMSNERPDDAIKHFDLVLNLAEETGAWDIIPVACDWMARCERDKGLHDAALAHIDKARAVRRAHDDIHNEGPIRILESIVLLEKGEVKRASDNLRVADRLLAGTDDYESLGNIQSAYGRIMHYKLQYDKAIEHFQSAIELFEKCSANRANIARIIVDVAYARFNTIRHLRRSIEVYVEGDGENGGQGRKRPELVKDLSALYETTLAELARAEQIYSQFSLPRGISKMHLIRGFIYLEMDDLELAGREAEDSYRFAETKNDFVLMSSARNLQCMVENTAFEFEIGNLTEHAMAALDYAREAVEFAANTPNRTLLASANISLGLTLSNSYFNLYDAAREAMGRAATNLAPDVRNVIRENFQRLKNRLREDVGLNSTLIQWAHGEIGAQTYRELEEALAGLIIPKVWEQERRRVKRVVNRLGISPKRVRKVLRRLGFLDATETKSPVIASHPKAPSGKKLRKPRNHGQGSASAPVRHPSR